MKNPSILHIGIFFISLTSFVNACTTIIVGKKASGNGKIMIARTSDTKNSMRAKNFQIYYDQQNNKSYLGLPYWDLEARQDYDMAQVATNHASVALSATETIQSNATALQLDPPSYAISGVTEPNIPNIVMPQAVSANQAVDILGQAIETLGVKNKAGFDVLIADQNEAWYLETLSGHQWVAVKIPDDVYFVVANGPGQIQGYDTKNYTYKMSQYQGKTPIQFAEEHRIANYTEGHFDFRASYGDVDNPINPNTN